MKNTLQLLNIDTLLSFFETKQDLKEIFEAFLDNTHDLISELENAHKEKNFAKISTYAHKIKSGYKQMLLADAVLIEEIEKIAKKGEGIDQIGAYLSELRSGYNAIIKEMQYFIREY